MNKKCYKCKEDKDVSKFYKDKTRRDGYNNICKECSFSKQKDYTYRKLNNIQHIKIKRPISKLKVIRKIKEDLSCCICKEDYVHCLEFHHIDIKNNILKEKPIHYLKRNEICKELSKCICVCANCHRKIHGGIIILCDEDIERFRIRLPENMFNNYD